MGDSGTVGDRLRRARRRRFVGRGGEIELFRGALSDGAVAVLFLHGPGGVGKSALLGEMAEAARQGGVTPVLVDARTVPPEASAFLRAAEVPGALRAAPDIVRALLARLVDQVPGPRHAEALQVCAHARFTTEELLRAMLGDDAGTLFHWLRTLSFVEEREFGLFPHDVVRDILDADLRWRDPDGYAGLHRRLRAHFVERARRAAEDERVRHQTVADIMFLSRNHPIVKGYWRLTGLGQLSATGPRPGDAETVLAMTREQQGAEQAASRSSPTPSAPPCATCTAPTGSPATPCCGPGSSAGRTTPPGNCAGSSRRPPRRCGTTPARNRCTGSSTGRSCARPRHRNAPPRCSGCRSAPTGGTATGPSSGSPDGSGNANSTETATKWTASGLAGGQRPAASSPHRPTTGGTRCESSESTRWSWARAWRGCSPRGFWQRRTSGSRSWSVTAR